MVEDVFTCMVEDVDTAPNYQHWYYVRRSSSVVLVRLPRLLLSLKYALRPKWFVNQLENVNFSLVTLI